MKIKKIAALVLALIMLLSLSGCGMDLKLTTAVLKLNKVQSLHADVDGALELTATDPSSSETFLASVVGGVDFSKEPLSAYADLNLAVMDEQLHILATLESQGDNAVLSYSLDDGATWETQDLGQLEGNMDLDPVDLLEGLGEAGDAIGNFTAVGTETVLGSDATRYDSVISGAVMAELMEENGAEDALENNLGMDVDFDFSNLPDVNLSVWVDKASGLPVKGCIDMSAMLQSMMDASLASILQAAGETGPISDYSLVVNQTYLSVTLSNFNNAGGVSDAREPNAGSLFGSAAGQSPLQIGSRWHGTMELSGHSGKGDLENGIAEVWGYLDTSGDRTYFEIYDFDIDLAPEGTELVPILSYWAEIDGNRIVPVIGEEDAWILNIYLDASDADELTFVYENGTLSASYFYYDGGVPEACDVAFRLTPPPTLTPTVQDIKVFFFNTEITQDFTMRVGDEPITLTAKAYPIDQFADATFTWKSEDSNYLKLTPSEDGTECSFEILATKAGGVGFTVTCNGTTIDRRVYLVN